MMDTVCKDLGKTYNEVYKLPHYLIKWHYFNAERRKLLDFEEKNEFQKLLVLLMRPDIYKEMEKKENYGETESSGYVETEIEIAETGQVITMSTFEKDDFNKLIKHQEGITRNRVLVEQTIEGKTKGRKFATPDDEDDDDAIFFKRL